jgi:glyoxalase family protein
MSTHIKGIHHITLCPAGAQEDVYFFTRVLGQRLVKQTVLMDGRIPIYHLYYGNADADLGSIATSFPYSRQPGRRGSGQVSAVAYSVPVGSLPFWAGHFRAHAVRHGAAEERFGRRSISVTHPAGLRFELVEEDADRRRPWATDQIGPDTATRGFFGSVLSVREIDDAERFFVDALGFRKIGVDGPYHRLVMPNQGIAATIDLHHEPDRAPGSWSFGAGTAHHIAFNVETDDALVRQKALYEELGYTDASELKDRFYFHSMYVRAPGGVLVECTSNVPGGFYQDEGPDELGTRLHLPPWYEEQRAAIVGMLEPLVIPDGATCRARAGRVAPLPVAALASAVPQPAAHATLSRTRAEFTTKPR